ncbi:MAG: flagellar type III secretion system pore protein FliP [Pirellulaceae bacterium]
MFETAIQSEGFQELAAPLQLALFLGGMVLLAGALVSLTAFTRIVIVLSFVRRALATQEIPPNPVIIGLSLFLTLFVMGPTLNQINDDAVSPLVAGEIGTSEALQLASAGLRTFMLEQTRERDLLLFLQISKEQMIHTPDETPMRILIPAFIVSELKTAFIMGFCIYVPFLLIDLVVSTVLMSLGMMMMPPMIVSTPCKIMLFVMVDGWHLVVLSLGNSFLAS